MAFKELATRRFSVRKYTNEPVSKEDIEYIRRRGIFPWMPPALA